MKAKQLVLQLRRTLCAFEFGSEDYPDLDLLTMRRLYRLGTPVCGESSRLLTVCHTVQTSLRFQYFFDGYLLDESKYFLGNHVFRSSDGKIYRFPVVFGSNISNTDANPARNDTPFSIRDAYEFDSQYQEIAYETYPECDSNGKMWYSCRYRLPGDCPDLEYLRFEAANALVPPVRMKSFRIHTEELMPWNMEK